MKIKLSCFYSLSIFATVLFILTNCTKKDDNNSNQTSQTSTLTDIDGNVYQAKTIGTQVWMVDNLKTKKFNDGTSIPLVIPDSIWEFLLTPAYCWYDNNEVTYENQYGGLYNWYAINSGKLAPTGWHIPSDEEWQILVNFLGGDLVAGGKMKEADTTHWSNPNSTGSNLSGFTALPGGMRDEGSEAIRIIGYYWSATEHDSSFAYGRTLQNTTPIIFRNLIPKTFGLSVRCVKN